MSIDVRRIHDCFDHYEQKSYAKVFSCDGCKMKGFGPRYICARCGRELHPQCRFPNITTTHEYFGCSTFTFREKPFTKLCEITQQREYSKCCDACGKDIRGFSYHCEDKKLDLHPYCCNLEKKVLIGETIYNMSENVSSKCILCKKRKISNEKRNVQGWSYVSTCNKYHIHVYCMTEMMQDEYMKNGELALEKVDLRHLIKSRRTRHGSSTFEMIKTFIKIILSVLLGDPTTFISNVVVEFAARGFQ